MPKPRRRSDTYDPNARVPLSLRVRPALKAKMEEMVEQTGRSLMVEAEGLIERALEYQEKRGGQRIERLLDLLGSVSRVAFEHEDLWLDDRRNWDAMMHLWSETLDAQAPPSLDRQEQISAARWTVDEFRRETDGSRREHLRQVLLSMSTDGRLPSHVRLECMGAAVMEEPQDEPITVDQVVEAGRGIAAEMIAATTSRRREHLHERLASMAQLAILPAPIRAEFQRALESPVVKLPSAAPPSGPTPDEWRSRPVHLFDAAWRLAGIASGRIKTPDEAMIAQAFAADESLFALAEMPGVAHDATAVLRYRQQIEQQRAPATGPRGEAAPPPRSARRRRAAPAERKV
jgi:hypothetical protein